MDRLSAGVAVVQQDSRPFPRPLHHHHHHQLVEEEHAWWSAADASVGPDSDDLFDLRSSVDHQPLPKTTSRLASMGGLSSCTEFSEEELRLAEVNPITFEQRHQSDLVVGLAAAQEQSMDVSCSAPCANQSQPPFRLSDDGDLASDGQSLPLAVYLSECQCGRPSSPSIPVHRSSHPSEDTSSTRVKLMCSFGGKIMPRPIDSKLRYVGGETRIVAVDRSVGYKDFMSKMAQVYGVHLALKYQLPDEDLDALVSVSSDDDLQNMMEEYDKLESGGGLSRLRLFFFTSPAEYEMSQLGFHSETEDEQRYVDAINGVPVKISAGHVEGDATGFQQVDGLADSGARVPHDAWSCTPVKTLSSNPSAPSSSPSSPPVVSKQGHFEPPGIGDSCLQILNERLNKVTVNPLAFEGSFQDVDHDGSRSSSGTSNCDPQYRLHAESPRTHHDVPISRGERRRVSEVGMHHVDSQTKLMHIDHCTGAADPWHDVHEHPSEKVLPQKELQRFILQQHKQILQQQPDWQSQMEVNLGRGEMMQHSTSDMHKQPQAFHHPHQAVQQPPQAAHFILHQTGTGHDGSFWNSEHQPIHPLLQGSVPSHPQVPIGLASTSTYQMGSAPTSPRVEGHLHQAVQQSHPAAHLILHQTVASHEGSSWNNEHQPIHGSMQSHTQLPLGLAPMPLYQMGSAPTSPKVAVQDYQGRCSCAQQHSQVHRGINVSLGEQSYSRRPPHFGDQHSRNHGLHNSTWFCDNSSHCGEPFVWQQQPSHFTALEAEQQGQIGNPWQHVHERRIAQYHGAECQARNRASQYCGPPVFTEAFLPSHETRKARYACMDCHDYRRQQHVEMAMGRPVYTDIQHQVGDWAMHQRNLELEEGRVSAVGRPYGKIPIHMDEDRRGEIEVEEWADSEPDLYCSHLRDEYESKGAQPLAASGGLHWGKFPVQVAPISRPLVSEDLQASQVVRTPAHGESERQTKLVAPKLSAAMSDLWNMPSLEPWPDLVPSLNAQASHRPVEEKAVEISYSKEIPRASAMDAVGTLEKISIDIGMCTGKHGRDTQSLLRDGSGRSIPSGGVVGEAAPDLLPVSSSIHEFSDSRCDGIRDSTMNAGVHAVSYDVIPISSLAPQQDTSSALPSWQALPPGTYNMMTLDGSLNTLAVPIYDQSPLSSINTTDFSFEPHEPSPTSDGAIVETEAFASRMSFTGKLADGMISSVLKSCSNEGGCEEGRDDHHDVGIKDIHEVNKIELEQGTEAVLVGSNSLLLPSTAHRQGWSVSEVDTANDWLKVGVEEDNLVGIIQESQNDVANDVTNKEKDAETLNGSVKEPDRLAFTPAEAEAIARGLQIIRNVDLEDMRELGSGTFGTVFHGKWRGSDVAIKRIKASCFSAQPSEQERLISDFWKEACTLAQLHHPNVVAFYGVVPDGPGGTLATVTEYMVNGSLKQVLHKKDRTIDRRKRLLIAMDAAFGMEYLHSKNIVHFDLKCENLLVNMRDAHRPICKVGDFGLSKVKHQTLVSGGVRGTLPWMAPELLRGNNSMVTEKIDVYSFGVVMWELLTGEEPYANMHCGAIIGGIVNNSLRPPIPCWCDPGWRTLMEKCWSAEPADRPAFTEVARELRAIAASMNVK